MHDSGELAAESGCLRQTMRDLATLSALPAVWGALSPEGVVQSLADVLCTMLGLDLSYVHLAGSAGQDGIEVVRGKSGAGNDVLMAAARMALAAQRAVDAPPAIPDPLDGQPLHVRVVRLGGGADIGDIVVGARRPGFPAEHERLLLDLGASQAALVLQRQLAERALAHSEARFLDLADAAPAMLWVTEPDGSCSFLSRGWYDFTGQGREEGLGFGWTEAIHPDDRQAAGDAFRDANAAKREFSLEHRVLHVDGSYRWVIDAGRPRLSPAGDFLGFVGNVLDISDRKQVEKALDTSQEMLSAVFDVLPVGVAVVDQDGTVRLSNREMHQYLPTRRLPSLDEARAERWRAMHADGSPVAREDFAGARALRGERVFPGLEALYTRDDGAEIWTQVAAAPLLDGEGRPKGQVTVVMNVDAFKRTEAARRLSEANQRLLSDELAKSNRNLSEFLAVLAHELRNPLAPLLTGLELMRRRADSAETVTQVRGIMERQVKQLAHLIDDLLDIARVTNGKVEIRKQSLDLKGIVSSAVETSLPLIEKNRHAFSLQLPAAPLPVSADATRIAQVIGNLLTNAAKYTPQGGAIRLSVEREGEEAVISVVDNGIGIPPESLRSVFDMFSQVGRNMAHSQGGLGIGLSLVSQLVALHGGSVAALSEGPGKGSTFVVRLPLDPDGVAAGSDGGAAVGSAAEKTRFRILVVDDNADAASTLAALLDAVGHEVRLAYDGPAALQAAEAFRPDVVFLDIGMPGMSGLEVARRLRTMAGLDGAALVAVSGWGAREDLARSQEAGFDLHLTKPVAPAVILDFLETLPG